MALPISGLITAAMINDELGRAQTAPFSLNGAEERALAGIPSGAISFADFYGKSNLPDLGYLFGYRDPNYSETLPAQSTNIGDSFNHACMSEDGQYLLVADRTNKNIRLSVRSGNTWSVVQTITDAALGYGKVVVCDRTMTNICVGLYTGAVTSADELRFYTRSGNALTARTTIIQSPLTYQVGRSLAMDPDTGDVVSFANVAVVYYERSGTSWSQKQVLRTASIGLNNGAIRGDWIVTGHTSGPARIYLYNRAGSGSNFSLHSTLYTSANSSSRGPCAAISSDASVVAYTYTIGTGDVSTLKIQSRSGTTYTDQFTFTLPDNGPFNPEHMVMNESGNFLLIHHNSEIKEFKNEGGTWSQTKVYDTADVSPNSGVDGLAATSTCNYMMIGNYNGIVDGKQTIRRGGVTIFGNA
ncbi:hypothetical protein NVP1081O_254 [Vibrio phage 1.081.O._10N.286.52.C2]|nr:hypothetical protein NVP1081O_254 [Vibrio phage 1.081.O._10N.286.52.C2]